MATRDQARLALTNKIEALKSTWTDYTLMVEYDNLNSVNPATQTKPYLCVQMMYLDGFQVDLAVNPQHRILGMIILEAKTKEGQGSKLGMDLLQHFYPSLHMTDANAPLRTQAVKFKTLAPKEGWAVDAALIPFWFDSTS